MTDPQPELLPQEPAETSSVAQAQSDEYRRRLAEALKDPAFRAIEGFPIGKDEDILALSDPPYYTACPNPFLPEIIDQWQQERAELRKQLGLNDDSYQREPFATDVSEGKNDPIYNAHSYHTKVPHKAIMRYILHYTDPGDIVFDGFCGTGMTGVAAQLCGDKKTVESLGYKVDENGVIWEGEKAISRLGARKAVLNDLSPAATFIAYNYNTPVDAVAFEREAKRILREVEEECGWMYETWHPNAADPNRIKGKINYTVWSDVFVCPNCGQEMVFWDLAVDQKKGSIADAWNCPACGTRVAKAPRKGSGALRAERAWETHFDRELKQTVRQAKQVPVLINYSVGKKRFEKRPDAEDLALIQKIEEMDIPYWVPSNQIFQGDKTSDPLSVGITHIHHFYTRRNIFILSALYFKINKLTNLLGAFISTLQGLSKMQRYSPGSTFPNMILSGTLYVGSLIREWNVINWFKGKVRGLSHSFNNRKSINKDNVILQTCSITTNTAKKNNYTDYVFIDPPFGSNVMYSELNFIWETWLRVVTCNEKEVIINKTQNKNLYDYQQLILDSFIYCFDNLKPGRWLTIVFHNSSNAIWNVIQETLQQAKFVIADVHVMDRKQETFNQSTSYGAVKKDLIISAYKPNGNLEERFRLHAGTIEGVWDFVRYHLGKLPVVNLVDSKPVVNAERLPFLLYDRMVAFHIQRGVMVPISAPDFYTGLSQHFIQRDGMYFLPAQVPEYDMAVLSAGKPLQLTMFVSDEKSAIAWLRQQLDPTLGGEPKTLGDLTNDFNRIMNRAKHEQQLELIEILRQNFLEDEQGKWYVPDANKQSDLEKIRQHALLREFKEYAQSTGRIKVFRSEAVRAGFADCFKRQDYATIVSLAERLPEDVLREDPDLLMYYDSALLRKK